MGASLHSVCICIVYFGVKPVWLDAYLKSCRENKTIDWLFVTDLQLDTVPENVHVKPMSFSQFKAHVHAALGVHFPREATPYKICDYRPTFGVLFENELKKYDFWAFGDIDVIYGNIRSFLSEDLMEAYDIVSTVKYYLAGPLTLLRNTESVRFLYREHADHLRVFQCKETEPFEERGFSMTVARLAREGVVKVYREHLHANSTSSQRFYSWYNTFVTEADRKYSKRHSAQGGWKHAEDVPCGPCVYDKGRIFHAASGREVMYFHIHRWKSMRKPMGIGQSDKWLIMEAGIISYDTALVRRYWYGFVYHCRRVENRWWKRLSQYIKKYGR